MIDPDLQQRFARRCTDAAFGYSTASTAAYAAMADQVLNLWSSVLQPPATKRQPEPQPASLWNWPVPLQPAAPEPPSMPLFNPFARIPVCGLIAQYNATELPPGPNRLPVLMRNVLTKRLLIRGFIVTDFAARFPDFIRDVPQWIKEGRIKYREDIAEGIENAPETFIGLLKGKNFGKQLIRVAE